MTLSEFKKELDFFYPAFLLDAIFSHKTRRFLIQILSALLFVSFVLASGIITSGSPELTGVFFLLCATVLLLGALDGFFYSYRFHPWSKNYVYDISRIVFSSGEYDLTRGFIDSAVGRNTLMRVGLDDQSINLFLQTRKAKISADNLSVLPSESPARSYINALLEADAELKTFLMVHSITEKLLWGSFCWTCDLEVKKLQAQMCWRPERLSKILPIGRTWAYGGVYSLKRYSSELMFNREQEHELHGEEIKNLEVLLTKNSGSNVLIVGDEGSGKIEIIEGVARKSIGPNAVADLKDKEYLVLSIDTLLSSVTDGRTLEKTLIGMMNEIIKSGNVIFVIPDLPVLIAGCSHIGVDIEELLSPYLRMNEIHIIAISSSTRFHSELSQHEDLMQHFSVLQIEGGTKDSVTGLLIEEVIRTEDEEGIVFSYPAILEAVSSAERYFVGAPLYDSASDLLLESASKAKLERKTMIVAEDILSLVKSKTGIATGEVNDSERQKLLDLETLLHQRIVGQDEAIRAVSDALRRARSGINNPNRPLGSFLFLGPTGVGKTETTKALAEIFFGQGAKILRVDMSEYNTPDALNRLIGGYRSETGGVLAQMIRDHQYGVLLLDEFEKTDSKVLDLFLQIIDEGIFTDAHGKKVSARNLIIVATSNAGSQIIFDTIKNGGTVDDRKDEIVDSIIRSGVFKPELINRFDGVVLFRPLEIAELRKVAELMLGRLIWRMKEKGMTLTVNDALLDFLAKEGNDPKFGARPLNRLIQDVIEEKIARGIIEGTYKPGSIIEFTKEELAESR